LTKDNGRKAILIVENLRVHYCAPAKALVAGYADVIELALVPFYSPERNPDEHQQSRYIFLPE
jgi:hypothetical protein